MAKRNMRNLEKIPGLTTKEKEAVSAFVRAVRRRFGPHVKEIVLFGSKAREDSQQYSDIDIVIVLESPSWEVKKAISELAAEENMKHDVLISTVRYGADEWENPVIKASPFGRVVRSEGIPL